jgi:hypothetical protein
MPSVQVVPDQLEIAFHDQRAVASAGRLLPATLAERLGIEQAADQLVDLGDWPGAAHQGASCSPWSMRWSPVATASMTWSCYALGRPAACSAIG